MKMGARVTGERQGVTGRNPELTDKISRMTGNLIKYLRESKIKGSKYL
jgi:hypothetical protein